MFLLVVPGWAEKGRFGPVWVVIQGVTVAFASCKWLKNAVSKRRLIVRGATEHRKRRLSRNNAISSKSTTYTRKSAPKRLRPTPKHG
jgi:hypothetical protein